MMTMTTIRRILLLLFVVMSSVSNALHSVARWGKSCDIQQSRLWTTQGSDDHGPGLSRRLVTSVISTATVTTTLGWFGSTSHAEFIQLPAESAELSAGLLTSRVLGNVLSPPPYGMEGPDIFYPPWFAGTWIVHSECTDVLAPCGIALFGGNRTYNAALADRERSKALKYESRFISSGERMTIADREFNVKSIAKVAMGENSVVDISLATPNKFSCLLSLEGAPSLITVDLLVLNRRQEQENATRFDCSEVVREIVSGVQRTSSAILKEVETTSLYTLDETTGIIRCQQRSATFLLPSQQDPMALQMWQATRGRPIDVRFYNVLYTKK